MRCGIANAISMRWIASRRRCDRNIWVDEDPRHKSPSPYGLARALLQFGAAVVPVLQVVLCHRSALLTPNPLGRARPVQFRSVCSVSVQLRFNLLNLK